MKNLAISDQTNDTAKRISFFETRIDLLSISEFVDRAEHAMATKRPARHTSLNVAKLINMRSNPELAADVNSSDLVGIDGMGIAVGLRLFGERTVERVAGIDLFYALLRHCAQTGRRPYILGAHQNVLEQALREAQLRYPGLEFAGWRNGYFSPGDVDRIVSEISQSGADCLFVAMPTPQKERFLNANVSCLGIPFIMGVGGSVDVLAGQVLRAPVWMRKSGLEWFHRLMMEPRKMAWRYVRTNTSYALLLATAALSGNNPVKRSI